MDAKNTNLDEFIRGRKQFIVPLFQRRYCWGNKQWLDLWDDLNGLCNEDKPRGHFIGSIVTIQQSTAPEGIPKYLLIDGQQRLTTIFILLALLRDRAKSNGGDQDRLAAEIYEDLLINRFAKQDNDFFRLMPTHEDRDAYKNIIKGEPNHSDTLLNKAYKFLDGKLKRSELDYEKIKNTITKYFSIVSIVLNQDDNANIVFESLNFKGQALTQADLVRNFFFMKIEESKQESVYNNYWLPIEQVLKSDNNKLTEFLRHFLMRKSPPVNKNDVYSEWKAFVRDDKSAVEYLKELKPCSEYYSCLINPADNEQDEQFRERFSRLNTIKVTTAYPLILNLYSDYKEKKLSKTDFIEILRTIENFLIRRFVCNIPTNSLNTIFSQVCLAMTNQPDGPVDAIKNLLQSQKYPKDDAFRMCFQQTAFYGLSPTKLILGTLEAHYSCKETVKLDELSIEHIMPQSPSSDWKKHLGENWEQTYELYLHTIGNLTLTGYNPELGNLEFEKKKVVYEKSNLSLNKYFKDNNISSWQEDDIKKRAEELAEQALKIWSYFGQDNSISCDLDKVTGTIPSRLMILDQQFEVKTWKEILEKTLNAIAEEKPDEFKNIAIQYPSYVCMDKNKLRYGLQLQNGYFVEANLSPRNIVNFLSQAIQQVGLSIEDWSLATI